MMHPIESTLKAAIEYICNLNKADGMLLAKEGLGGKYEFVLATHIDNKGHITRNADYTEEVIVSRIAGAPVPPGSPSGAPASCISRSLITWRCRCPHPR